MTTFQYLGISVRFIIVLYSAQHSEQPETRQVNGIVGTFFYFPERVLTSGNLLYGDLGNIAQVYPGKQSNTNLEKRYKNRLHWNNVTGVFTLSDLQIDDSGVYTVENGDAEEKMTHTFQLTVYYVLSKPQVDEQNRDSYRCEAANPVSKETAVVPHSCIESDPFKVTDGDCLIIAVICVLVASGLVVLAIYLKKRRNEHSHAGIHLLMGRSEQVYKDWSHLETTLT
ncbi:uncharacterized protein LOC110534352 isoform X5 [Oncorhynchus mykiss]|uniref:uncharacterized protein LOC110534352 isoform X5 n=1 Tax=Oncorhynchus mykiss TaxID=8022 RepID=UPI0018786F21|nr:uncharacterized protein LOC110534352 isoform X5 [Oncorhynchus mykiss]